MADDTTIFDMLQRFAANMIDKFEINDMLYELGDTVTTLLEASGSGVSVITDNDRLSFVTSTSEAVIELERAQEDHQAGPCVEAFRTGEVVTVSKISELDRWPEYRAAAAHAGFESVAGFPLAIGERHLGSLNVYDTIERTWTDRDLRAARVLADIATTYILRSGELAEAKQLSEQLQNALDTRIVIEQAKGMLARDHDISVDQAFDMLRKLSRDRATPLRTIADAVVTLGLRLPPQT